MKKKGFTLVELLAVIVILAIIALIAIPLIGNVIEKAKIGALESSVNGLVESANMYYANNTIKGETVTETIFDFEDGEQVSTQKLEYKGKVYNGKLILHANGEVAVCIDDAEHYAYKNKNTDEIVSGNGTCLYDGTTGDFSSNSSINDLRGKTIFATQISESPDGLNALITIPEEGHYDEKSKISVSISDINNNLGGGFDLFHVSIKNSSYNMLNVGNSYDGSTSTYTSTDNSALNSYDRTKEYIIYDLGEPVFIENIKTIGFATYIGGNLASTSYKRAISISNDGTNFEDVYIDESYISNAAVTSVPNTEETFNISRKARYIKMRISEQEGNIWGWAIREIYINV